MKKQKNAQDTTTEVETKRPYKRYSFEYNVSPSCLHVKIITSMILNGKAISRSIEEKDFPLSEITPKQLLKYRAKKSEAGFVLKISETYLYAKIPKSLRISTQKIALEGFEFSKCDHLCGNYCKRLSAAEDNKGGCAKVRDLSLSALLKEESFYEKNEALEVSERIEKYPFITFGFESFNTISDATYVLICQNYKKQNLNNTYSF